MAADTVEKIKAKLSIVEVVQPYVKLTKAGRYWRGLTPFGKEKTPSFYVNPERGTYYCFSTSQGGDHFTFIEKMEGVDFKGAMKILADKAGIEVEWSGKGNRGAETQARDRLREAMREAENFFARALTEESSAFAYASSRGLTPETIRAWNLGLAPDGWRGLLETLGTLGYSPKELATAGLVKEADEKPGTWYDRFRNRLMFPIRDAAGRTVAFTGRALSPDDQAKYLNSPETELFKKSELLFGMDRAKDAIRSRGFAILVEGQFDLLLLHQAGFQNTVALSGTALSDTHLTLIKRYADNLMLCLDADRAGLASSARSARAALASGMRVKAVRIPKGKDPADIVAEDPKSFTQLVKGSQSVAEFFLSVLSAEEEDELKLLRQVEEVVLPLVAATKSPLEQQRLIDIIARALSTTPEAVRSALPKESDERRRGGPEQPSSAFPQTSKGASSVKARRDLVLAAIVSYPDTPLAKRLTEEYSRIIGAPPPSEGVDERLLFEAGLVFGETPDVSAGDDLLAMFERAVLTEGLHAATLELRRAEVTGDETAIREAAEACKDLSTRLAALN
ncbi:MAG TPA: DNA primase [Candidatus Paceibacterota bacterium]|jgi:DNA primase